MWRMATLCRINFPLALSDYLVVQGLNHSSRLDAFSSEKYQLFPYVSKKMYVVAIHKNHNKTFV